MPNRFLPGESAGIPTFLEPIRPRIQNIFDPGMQAPRDPFQEQMQSGLGNAFEQAPIDASMISGPPTQRNRIEELYTPETYFQDEYKKLLSEIPQRNKPGIWRKIGASIVGAGGYDTNDFLYAPYNRKMEDWKLKREAMEPGLTAERYANANERQLASSDLQFRTNERRQVEVERKNAAAEELANRKQELAELKARGYTFKTGDDGFIYGISPIDGSSVKTKVKARELSLAEATDIQTKADIKEIESRGAIQERINNADNLAAAERARLSAETQAQIAELRAEVARGRVSNPVQAFDKEGKPLPYMVAVDGRGNLKTIPLPEGAVTRPTPPGAKPKDAEGKTVKTVVRDKDGNVIGEREVVETPGDTSTIKMQFPDKSIRLVPKNRQKDMEKVGGKVVK